MIKEREKILQENKTYELIHKEDKAEIKKLNEIINKKDKTNTKVNSTIIIENETESH